MALQIEMFNLQFRITVETKQGETWVEIPNQDVDTWAEYTTESILDREQAIRHHGAVFENPENTFDPGVRF